MGGAAPLGSPDEAECFPDVNFLENKTGIFVFELSHVLPKMLQSTALLDPVEGQATVPNASSPPHHTLIFCAIYQQLLTPGPPKLPVKLVLPPISASRHLLPYCIF